MPFIDCNKRPYTDRLAKLVNAQLEEQGVDINTLCKGVDIRKPNLLKMLNC